MDITYFRERIRINKHALDEEIETHADHMERIGRQSVKAARREAIAKRDRDEIEHRLVNSFSQDNEKLAFNKATSQAKATREYREAQAVYLDAQNELAEWQEVEKAWYQRGFDLRALVELYSSQYFHSDPTANAGRRDSRKKVDEYMDNRTSEGAQTRTRVRRRPNDDE